MNYPDELIKIAEKVVWFKPGHQTLQDKVYFLCYLMQYGLTEDVVKSQQYFKKADFQDALKHAYPGILNQRSWSYWNLVIRQQLDVPMPKRGFSG